MNLFITGAEGFVGRNLINYLIENTDFRIYYCDNGKFSIPLDYFNDNRIIKVCEDISQIQPLDFKKINVLIHLAAVKKHNVTLEDESDIMSTNIINTRRLFNLAIESNIDQIIFSSSLYASGNMHKLLFTEDELAIPSTLYGSTKLFAEGCLRELSLIKNIPLTVLRFYFIYGPHQYYGKGYPSVFLSTLNSLKNNKPPIIINDGKQKLDYLYVDDLSSLILESIKKPISGFSIVNACSSNAYEIDMIINSLVDLWNEKFGTCHKAYYHGNDFTSGTYRSGSNKLAKKYYNWEPKVSINDGLQKVFNWYIDSQSNLT